MHNENVLTDFFVSLVRVRSLQKTLWRGWYEYLARGYRNADWTFMNYGFDDPDATRLTLELADESDQFCIQLYDHVTAPVDLQGKQVLEVGCGRGGGCSFLARYKNPQQMIGVDLSSAAIDFCRKTHHAPGLEFRTGDAEQLPFNASSFDVVVNVESSHCYPDLPAFFKEVRRVLKPSGYFLYADIREASDLNGWRDALRGSGFSIISDEDITRQVVSALDRDNERKVRMINSLIPAVLRSPFHDFAGTRGTRIYEAFRSGSLTYRRFSARRSEST